MSPEHVAARRAQILDAARTVFARRGIQAATMAEICAEAGLSAGAVYGHFDGKRALQEAVYAEAREANRRFPDAIRGAEDPAAAVLAMARYMFAPLDDPALHREHLLALHVVAEASHDEELAASYRAVHRDMIEAFGALLQDTPAVQRHDEPVDVEALVTVLTSLYQGVRASKMVSPDLDLDRLGRMVQRLLEPLLGGEAEDGDGA